MHSGDCRICGYSSGDFAGSAQGARSSREANESKQLLTPVEEKAILRWIRVLESWGFPPKLVHVRQAAARLAGKHHNMGNHQLTQRLKEAHKYRFSFSQKGWINRVLAMEWLRNPFHPHTTTVVGNSTRLFILDRHDSHTNCIVYIGFCIAHNVVAYCLPPHSTHRLRPIDVGFFGPLNQYYTRHVMDLMAAGNITIQKGNFLPLYIKVRKQAYTTSNIISAYRTCKIVPLNFHIVLSELEPPTEPTAQAQLPQTPNDSSSLLRQARQIRLQLRAQ